MRTLAEEYAFNLLEANILTKKTGYGKDENRITRHLKYVGAGMATRGIAAAVGKSAVATIGKVGGVSLGVSIPHVAGMGAYYLYRKHKKAKMQADMEKDPAKKLKLNAQANQLKQDANKKKVENQKKQRLQKHAQELQKQTMQKQAKMQG